ncbi:MAG: hypothetical protein A3I68_06310 [Candidatus Melainabacteria bacterium RIFCSPLOWO2_02_FULL_35_15]|nr:MAG: hypothetical protein A3F80_08115 [Candidatus Melainabacteria bacterium RIFCSPLOWO2_12_FULL_35_11]OGI14578.1 MAG: hypothetical protein A3I68_06310 [Candidatus Melainabacteria bacterium RIFCSPLOWO2_02_FULL_35_15]
MKRELVVHPFLVASYPVLFLLSNNIRELHFNIVIIPLIIINIFIALIWIIVSKFIKDGEKSSLIISLIAFMFFTYGHFFKLLRALELRYSNLVIYSKNIYLILIWLVLFIVIIFVVLRCINANSTKQISYSITLTYFILVIFCLINVCQFNLLSSKNKLSNKQLLNLKINNIKPEYEIYNNNTVREPKDIYYLIFDRYANETVLKEYFNFDNSAFLNHLIDNGFYIARDSKANYPRTFLSLASSLNMDYFYNLKNRISENITSFIPVYELIHNSEVVKILKSFGYKFINIGGWYHVTSYINSADINISYNSYLLFDEFYNNLIQTTILFPIYNKFIGYNLLRNCTQYQLKKLIEISKSVKVPKFVFAHILLPHLPYLFKSNGDCFSGLEDLRLPEDKKYIQQLLFTNEEIKKLIESIILNSSSKPIIIIQSDEGPYILSDFKEFFDTEAINWSKLSLDSLKIHLRILNAYYLPDVGKERLLYSSISPVNTFRIIFNLYFGQNFKLLEDDSYIFEDYSSRPLHLRKIVEKI